MNENKIKNVRNNTIDVTKITLQNIFNKLIKDNKLIKN